MEEDIPKNDVRYVLLCSKYAEAVRCTTARLNPTKQNLSASDDIREELVSLLRGAFDCQMEIYLVSRVEKLQQILQANSWKTDENKKNFMFAVIPNYSQLYQQLKVLADEINNLACKSFFFFSCSFVTHQLFID